MLNIKTFTCESNCPSNFTKHTDISIWEDCYIDKLYFNPESNNCSLDCPMNYYKDELYGCIENGKIVYQGNIISECPKNTILNTLTNKCERCSGKFTENGICTDACSRGYISDINNECKSCSELNLIAQENECVDECDTNKYEYNYLNNNCEPLSEADDIKSSTDVNDKSAIPKKTNNENNKLDPNCACVNGICLPSININKKSCLLCKCNNAFYGEFCSVENKKYN